jgi:starch phosphorylase
MNISPCYLLPPIPQGLEELTELALDLRWSWSHAADELWERMEPELWALTRNPWLILQTVASARLQKLADDPSFRDLVARHLQAHREALNGPAWFQQNYSGALGTVAYFSMEFGLSEALPLYSGGLGILAGDFLKTASDLGVPVVGVGLLYQQGYFRQALDASGSQMEFYPYNDPSQLPVLPVRERDGEWLRLEMHFPGRRIMLRAWEATVGRVRLYLLDSNDPVNSPADRGITSELYGGGPELRLQQEIVLGIGGWRLLRALGLQPEICHLNEGHAALAVLERARAFMVETGQPFAVALAATRAGNIFTTHTPVDAGFDRFHPELAGQYLGGYAEKLGIGLARLLALGREKPESGDEPLNMAYLALRGAGMVNGVSRLHGEVSRGIFQRLFPRWPRHEVPVIHVTNGVHVPSWDSAGADALWSGACGKERWLGALATIEEDLRRVPDERLWEFRRQGRRELIHYARERLAWQLERRGATSEQVRGATDILDPEALTIGFARRFATYKRPNLLLHDEQRLTRLLGDPQRPVQLIVAGKAHPRDEAGKALVRQWTEFVRRPGIRFHAIFLVDYDMALAEKMVQGVDLWINTPRRPWEACGTSGMKVLVNGGLNLSELDGWWAEAYSPETGWALGDGREHGDDPAWDAREAGELYRLLEELIIPCFYDRNGSGIPRAWVARMRASMADLTPRFSSNRMLREYVEGLYLPAATFLRSRVADGAGKARALCRWSESLDAGWSSLRFGPMEVHEDDGEHRFTVRVYLGNINPEAVRVELYAEPQGSAAPERHSMACGDAPPEEPQARLYRAHIPAHRPAADYTPRIVPAFDGAAVPLEAPQLLWYR